MEASRFGLPLSPPGDNALRDSPSPQDLRLAKRDRPAIYTVFFDSMAATSQATTDGTGPGQRLTAAITEAGERIQRCRNEVKIR